jgi:hypothetical protein
MLTSIRGKVLLAGVFLFVCASALGQKDDNREKQSQVSTDFGLTYAAERAYIAPGNCDCFWFNGGGADAAVTFWKGLGISAALTGDHASDITPGVDISKVSYLAGPRYTYKPWVLKVRRESKLPVQAFGEALFGGVHAFDGAFPSATGVKSSADSYAMQIGGGVNIFISKRFAIRFPEVDYVRTALPNGASDVQNDLRLGFGVTCHLPRFR